VFRGTTSSSERYSVVQKGSLAAPHLPRKEHVNSTLVVAHVEHVKVQVLIFGKLHLQENLWFVVCLKKYRTPRLGRRTLRFSSDNLRPCPSNTSVLLSTAARNRKKTTLIRGTDKKKTGGHHFRLFTPLTDHDVLCGGGNRGNEARAQAPRDVLQVHPEASPCVGDVDRGESVPLLSSKKNYNRITSPG